MKECKHETTRKLFAQHEKKWLRTEYSYCIDCKAVLTNKFEVKK